MSAPDTRANFLKKRLTAGCRATRAVHEHEHARDIVGILDLAQQLHLRAIVHDGSFDDNARNVLAGQKSADLVARHQVAADRDSEARNGEASPKTETAAKLPSIQNNLGFQRHPGFTPSFIYSGHCRPHPL